MKTLSVLCVLFASLFCVPACRANLIWVEFQVHGAVGDPLDDQNHEGYGWFTFDDVFLTNPNGLQAQDISFDWAGTHWDTGNAGLQAVLNNNGALGGWMLGGKNFGYGIYIPGGSGDFIIDMAQDPYHFSYWAADRGDLTSYEISWDTRAGAPQYATEGLPEPAALALFLPLLGLTLFSRRVR